MDLAQGRDPLLSDDVVRQLREIGDRLTYEACRYTNPVIIKHRGGDILNTATGFLVDFDDARYLVTNAHVLDRFDELGGSGVSPMLVFGGIELDPGAITKAPAERVDLAVLNVSGLAFDQAVPGPQSAVPAKLQAYRPTSWPPSAPILGEGILTVGYLGIHRSTKADGTPQFAAFPMLGLLIGGVADTAFAIPLDRDRWIASDYDPTNRVIDETNFGGLSGSPVFALPRTGADLELIGIVRGDSTLDVLYCTRADLLKRDGTIDER